MRFELLFYFCSGDAQGAQYTRDGASRAYDATAETLGSAGSQIFDTVGSTKDRVLGSSESGTQGVYDAAGNYYSSAREMAARTGETVQGHIGYAGEKLSQAAQATRDAAFRVSQLLGSSSWFIIDKY